MVSLARATSFSFLNGTRGDDAMDGHDTIAQRITGYAGNDTIKAGARDKAYGGNGDDTFIARSGSYLVGGRGSDTFVFERIDERHFTATIADFMSGDHIDISDLLKTCGGSQNEPPPTISLEITHERGATILSGASGEDEFTIRIVSKTPLMSDDLLS